MKDVRTTILTTAALVATIISLTGCSGAPEDNAQYNGYPPYDTPSLISVNPETGKVTKFVDVEYVDEETTTEEVLFDEGSAKGDFEMEYAVNAYPNPNFDGSYELSSTVTVEGKQYPIKTNLSWQWMPMDIVNQITLYNERIASGDNSKSMLQDYTMAELIRASISQNVGMAVSEGAFPTPQHQITGRSVTEADTRVVAGWQAGVPAWQTLQEIKGSEISSERYYYSFLCATYDVTMTNGQEVLDLAKSLPDAQYVQFNVGSNKSTLLIETAQPCTIEQYDQPNNGGSSNNSPVPPPSDNPPSDPWNN